MRFLRYLIEAREMFKDWQKYVKDNKELAAGVQVLQKINKAGFKAFIVGGYVRDCVLGANPKDIDIATNAPMEILEKMFKTHDIGKSKSFGIVVIRQGPFNFEIAQFRQDGKYKDGRRPESVTITGEFKQDVERRDFTINAMGINAKGEIIDYFSGRKDIKNKILRTVGDPRKRFGEDYLRILRLGRFSAKLGFDIEKKTQKAAQKLSTNIKELAPERVYDELMKAAKMEGTKFADYIIQLDKLKLLRFILPEVLNLKFYKERLDHHPETKGRGGTVYAHTIEALRKVGVDQPIVMLSTMLHDVGKGLSFSEKEGLPRYLRHARASVDLVKSIAERLKMSNKDRDALLFAVGNHMKFHDILKIKPSKIAKLVSDDNWDVLVATARADEFSRGQIFMYKGEFEKIVDKAIKIKEKFGIKKVNNQLKLVDGNRVKNILGIPEGPKVGEVIRKTTEFILDNNIDPKDQNKIDDFIRKIGK